MPGVNFDFARYVALRRGAVEQRARDGAAYSYAGARKVQRTLGGTRPVAMAIEATTRLWKSAAKSELLGTSIRVTDQQFPEVYRAAATAAGMLGIAVPNVYVAPARYGVRSRTLGTDDDPYIIINTELVEHLTAEELLSVLGHECGAIQNNQVVYHTALHYLTHSAMSFVRWIVQPAVMALQAWSRRAEITCDRAAVICTRNLETTFQAMLKVELGLEVTPTLNLDTYLEQLPGTRTGIGKYAELFRSNPYLPKRVQALKLFSEGRFYRRYLGETNPEGPAADEVDQQVAEILSVF